MSKKKRSARSKFLSKAHGFLERDDDEGYAEFVAEKFEELGIEATIGKKLSPGLMLFHIAEAWTVKDIAKAGGMVFLSKPPKKDTGVEKETSKIVRETVKGEENRKEKEIEMAKKKKAKKKAKKKKVAAAKKAKKKKSLKEKVAPKKTTPPKKKSKPETHRKKKTKVTSFKMITINNEGELAELLERSDTLLCAVCGVDAVQDIMDWERECALEQHGCDTVPQMMAKVLWEHEESIRF